MAQDEGATILKNTAFALEVAFDSEIDKRTMPLVTAKAHELVNLQKVAVKRIMVRQPDFFDAWNKNFTEADVVLCVTSGLIAATVDFLKGCSHLHCFSPPLENVSIRICNWQRKVGGFV